MNSRRSPRPLNRFWGRVERKVKGKDGEGKGKRVREGKGEERRKDKEREGGREDLLNRTPSLKAKYASAVETTQDNC